MQVKQKDPMCARGEKDEEDKQLDTHLDRLMEKSRAKNDALKDLVTNFIDTSESEMELLVYMLKRERKGKRERGASGPAPQGISPSPGSPEPPHKNREVCCGVAAPTRSARPRDEDEDLNSPAAKPTKVLAPVAKPPKEPHQHQRAGGSSGGYETVSCDSDCETVLPQAEASSVSGAARPVTARPVTAVGPATVAPTPSTTQGGDRRPASGPRLRKICTIKGCERRRAVLDCRLVKGCGEIKHCVIHMRRTDFPSFFSQNCLALRRCSALTKASASGVPLCLNTLNCPYHAPRK